MSTNIKGYKNFNNFVKKSLRENPRDFRATFYYSKKQLLESVVIEFMQKEKVQQQNQDQNQDLRNYIG